MMVDTITAGLVAKQGQKEQCSNDMCERFTSLPEPIIHHIFSFLDLNDIARIGVLSKRCRQVFMSNPYLKFVSNCSFLGPSNVCEQFSDCVDELIRLRNGLKILRLCINWVCRKGDCNVDGFLVDKWISIALSCGAQELDLDVGVKEGAVFRIPKCVFSSTSLRVLKLSLDGNSLEKPYGVFPSLEELYFHDLKVSEKYLNKWISTACPSLRRLTAKNITGFAKFCIISPFLEELTLCALPYNLWYIEISSESLQKLSLDLHSIFPSYARSMKIIAPKLIDFSLTAGTALDISFSDFECLQIASINVSVPECYLEEVIILDRLVDLLQKVRFVRELNIDCDILEALFLHNFRSIKFDNLRHLSVAVRGLRNYHFPALASTFTDSLNLESLHLKCRECNYPHYYKKELESKVSELYSDEFDHQFGQRLNEIVVQLQGKGHQIGLVEKMVTLATALTSMTIYYTQENFYSLSDIGLQNPTCLPFKVNLIEQDFGIDDF